MSFDKIRNLTAVESFFTYVCFPTICIYACFLFVPSIVRILMYDMLTGGAILHEGSRRPREQARQSRPHSAHPDYHQRARRGGDGR